MAWQKLSDVGGAVVAAAAASGVRSHVGRQDGGARVVGGLGIGRGARSLSTAPRCVATNLRPDLNSIRPATTTFPTHFTTTLDCLRTARSELYRTNTFPSHTRREYATMASATSFFDFKPKDSMSALQSSFPLHTGSEGVSLTMPHTRKHTCLHPPSPFFAFHTPTDVIRHSPLLSSRVPQLTSSVSQKRANPTTSLSSLAKSSSSSTRPQNAASHRNSRGSRSSTRTSRPSTPTTLKSSVSLATSLVARTPAQTTRFRSFARSTTA